MKGGPFSSFPQTTFLAGTGSFPAGIKDTSSFSAPSCSILAGPSSSTLLCDCRERKEEQILKGPFIEKQCWLIMHKLSHLSILDKLLWFESYWEFVSVGVMSPGGHLFHILLITNQRNYENGKTVYPKALCWNIVFMLIICLMYLVNSFFLEFK